MPRIRSAAALILLCAVALAAAEAPAEQEVKACRAAIARFAGALMDELGRAMEAGGPKAAVTVCRDKAPGIAAKVSQESGISLRRTALKVRNPENAPDAWERATLEAFQARVARGEAMDSMEASEVVTEGGRRVLRFMKAIPVKSTCLTCHGADVDPELLKAVRGAYPKDEAVGFSAGDLRGAFSLRMPLGDGPKAAPAP